jgi:hypothetical protein
MSDTVPAVPKVLLAAAAAAIVFALSTAAIAAPPRYAYTSEARASATPKQQARAGGVTFAARLADGSFLRSKGVGEDLWGFTVSLDTHSVNLSDIDIESRAVLRTGRGGELKPVAWRGVSEDSHHRSGLLLFSVEEAKKHGIESGSPGPLELVLRDVAGVKERVLRWE